MQVQYHVKMTGEAVVHNLLLIYIFLIKVGEIAINGDKLEKRGEKGAVLTNCTVLK